MKKTLQKTKIVLGHICMSLVLVSVLSIGNLTMVAAGDNAALQPAGGGTATGGQPPGGGTATGGQPPGGGTATGGQPAGGGTSGGKVSNFQFTNPLKNAPTLAALLNSLLRVVTMLGAIVVVFFFILAGFNYVTARGDSAKISAATKTFTWTAVGAAIILGAQVIARVIQNTVTQLGS